MSPRTSWPSVRRTGPIAVSWGRTMLAVARALHAGLDAGRRDRPAQRRLLPLRPAHPRQRDPGAVRGHHRRRSSACSTRPRSWARRTCGDALLADPAIAETHRRGPPRPDRRVRPRHSRTGQPPPRVGLRVRGGAGQAALAGRRRRCDRPLPARGWGDRLAEAGQTHRGPVARGPHRASRCAWASRQAPAAGRSPWLPSGPGRSMHSPATTRPPNGCWPMAEQRRLPDEAVIRQLVERALEGVEAGAGHPAPASTPTSTSASAGSSPRTVAIGADHGGFALKASSPSTWAPRASA